MTDDKKEEFPQEWTEHIEEIIEKHFERHSVCPNCDNYPAIAEFAKISWFSGIKDKGHIMLDLDGLRDYKSGSKVSTGTCKVCGRWETLTGNLVTDGGIG